MTQIVNIPLDKLLPGDKAKGGSINSRQADAPVDGLASSIAHHGLLIPLLVRAGDGEAFYVMDGNRRLAALNLLKTKKLVPELIKEGIPCIPSKEGNALELSMIANIDRERLHPVDQFEVFAAMIGAGDTADLIAKRYSMTVKQVRQALALGKLAPAIRDAWRNGDIDAEIAEVFALSSDHKAQTAALKKAGKDIQAWRIREALLGTNNARSDIARFLNLVGRKEYEAAGFQINESLFADEDKSSDTVSDFPALRRMVTEKFEAKCEELVKDGWKWAILKTEAPNDIYSWKRIHPEGGKFTKEHMAVLGCVVGFDYNGKVEITKGYVKPGDKISVPKPAKQKKAEAKVREERKENTGGLSNALAYRMSQQLTLAVREATATITTRDIIAVTIACLASNEGPSKLKLGTDDDMKRDADFAKYLKLAAGKSPAEALGLLAIWISKSIDLTVHRAEDITTMLHPGKSDSHDVFAFAEYLPKKEFAAAALKHFDRDDYFNSISKSLIVEAVREALGKDHADRVAKLSAPEAKAYAIKNVKIWVPPAFRLK